MYQRPSRQVWYCGLACGVLIAAGSTKAQRMLYVDQDATGPVHDGSSWCQAYTELYEALAVATSGDTIRVAEGKYAPETTGLLDPREATFQLANGITIEGGYAGCGAADPNERDVAIYETTLSGDLAGNDAPDFINNDENVYHVITGSGTDDTAVLDGFFITGGNADEPSSDSSLVGGGMYNENGSPTLVHCTFHHNSADYRAGGMFNTAGSPTLVNCAFRENFAGRVAGGMYNEETSNPTLTDCTFQNNVAGIRTGGMYNSASHPTLTNCAFIGNIGGGMCNAASSPALTHCRFIGNSGPWGGGMSNSNSNPTVVNCVFVNNSAGYAGGMCNDHFSYPTLTNCTFSGNSADLGAGIANGNSVPTLTNCILWGNTDGGGSGESAQIYIDGDPPVLDYSCVQGWTGDLGGIGNIGDDPLFVPGPAGCHYLSQTTAGHAVDSPCVDAGSDTAANLGLDTLTTRSDEGVDAGTADMGYHYPVIGQPLIMGDFDRDGRVTLADVAELQNCFTGDGPAAVSPCCRIFDFEPDEDVDLDDYALFRWALSGPLLGG